MNHQDFLEKVYNWSSLKNKDNQFLVDFIVAKIDDSFKAGNFAFVDNCCKDLDINKLNDPEIAAFVVTSAHGRKSLNHFGELIENIKQNGSLTMVGIVERIESQ